MTRRLFTFASAISLLLLAAGVALWVRSYRTTDVWGRAWVGESLSVVSIGGHVVIERQQVPEVAEEAWSHRGIPTRRFDERCVRRPAVWSFAGLSFERSDPALLPGWHSRVWVVPYYAPLMLCLMLPAMRVRSGVAERIRRRRPGLCRVCGYDIRASTGRCSECGTSIPVGEKA